jgi:hypothetical protein
MRCGAESCRICSSAQFEFIVANKTIAVTNPGVAGRKRAGADAAKAELSSAGRRELMQERQTPDATSPCVFSEVNLESEGIQGNCSGRQASAISLSAQPKNKFNVLCSPQKKTNSTSFAVPKKKHEHSSEGSAASKQQRQDVTLPLCVRAG